LIPRSRNCKSVRATSNSASVLSQKFLAIWVGRKGWRVGAV